MGDHDDPHGPGDPRASIDPPSPAGVRPSPAAPSASPPAAGPPEVAGAAGTGGGAGTVPPAAGPPRPGPQRPHRRQRFVISQRLAPYGDDVRLRRDMVDLFSMRIDRHMLANADLVADLGGGRPDGGERRIVVVEADPDDMAAHRAALTADAIVEPVLSRLPCVVGRPLDLSVGAGPVRDPGRGGALSLTILGTNDVPVAGAQVVALLRDRGNAAIPLAAGAVSDAAGAVTIPYDPNVWLVSVAAVTPHDGYWSEPVTSPQSGQVIRLTRLPDQGPFGWWHWLTGASGFDLNAGQGITIGIIDTGVGPHPALDHVIGVGSVIDTLFAAGTVESRDIAGHGTHVAGLIAARPQAAGQYGGLAPGADVRVIRVFRAQADANQGDIAKAITALSSEHNADLINLSLGGKASEIERDAIIMARRYGTLCIAAAGNDGGYALEYPAGYPECAAVSALGLVGCAPAGTTAGSFGPVPGQPLGTGGLFHVPFSNADAGLACASAGLAIISTVPARAGGAAAPYAEMTGTSMAAPLATGALAALLGRDPTYRGSRRNEARSAYAASMLAAKALPIGLPQVFEGRGLARAR